MPRRLVCEQITSSRPPSRIAKHIFIACWGMSMLGWIPATGSGPSDAEVTSTSDLDKELFRDLGGFQPSEPTHRLDQTNEREVDPASTTDGKVLPTVQVDHWVTLQQRMREVQRRLNRVDIGLTTTRLQQEIVDGLRDLLQQTSRPSPPSANGAGALEQSTNPSAGRPTHLETSQALTETSSNRASSPLSADQLNPRELLERTWGHLPSDVREQLHAAQPEQFLPEYSQQIEQYFRSVSELDRTVSGSP